MSDSQSQAPDEHALLSPQYDELKEALEVLYIIANLSGRIHFAKSWESVAGYIFGDELMQYDQQGAEDRERRAELEQSAEQRRIDFLEVMDTLEDKSADKGALQIEYVQSLVQKYGRDVSLLLYSQKIVDRFAPPPAAPSPPPAEDATAVEELAKQSDQQEPTPVKETAPVQPPEVHLTPEDLSQPVELPKGDSPDDAAMKDIEEDPMDAIKPIDMSAPAPSASTEPPAETSQEISAEPVKQAEPQAPVAAPSPPVVPPSPPAAPAPVKTQDPAPVPDNTASPPAPAEQAQEPSFPPPPVQPQPVKPVTNSGQQEGSQQRPVEMKFVSSKDRKKEPDSPSQNPEDSNQS